MFCCCSKKLFLVQKPLASDNETVPGEGQFQDKTWKEVIEEILTKNDISADKIALGKKNIVTEEDPFFLRRHPERPVCLQKKKAT